MSGRKAVAPWKDRLQPFGEMYAEFEDKLRDRLLDMTDAELQQLIADAEEPDQTNCWWATFAAAPQVRGQAKNILRRRAGAAAQGDIEPLALLPGGNPRGA